MIAILTNIRNVADVPVHNFYPVEETFIICTYVLKEADSSV